MLHSVRRAISLLLLATMMVSTAAFAWKAAWITHAVEHAHEFEGHPQALDGASDGSDHDNKQNGEKLSDLEHQLLHEMSHHTPGLTALSEYHPATQACLARISTLDAALLPADIKPPYRPPRLLASLA